MKKFDYLFFKLNTDIKISTIKNIPKKIPDSFQLKEGVILGASYPSNVQLDISPDSGDIITDFVNNTSRCILINSIVKEVFEAECIDEETVEFLPFKLVDKKNRTSDKLFYIANVLARSNCFDYDNSLYTRSTVTGNLLDVERIKILNDQVPETLRLFRIGEYPSRIAIRSDLLDILEKKGFTGISVIKQGESFI